MNPGQRLVRAIGFVAALVPLPGGLAPAADLPQWDLSKLEGLASAQWGPPVPGEMWSVGLRSLRLGVRVPPGAPYEQAKTLRPLTP